MGLRLKMKGNFQQLSATLYCASKRNTKAPYEFPLPELHIYVSLENDLDLYLKVKYGLIRLFSHFWHFKLVLIYLK